ncbi:uncharacterized protein LOC6569983 isoform X1 [Drosophila grimshawi]|uniref:uncharacterized protein LOC6569983 isoform X1 n=1 Tax=Drosophila grimshawi TaxID=7222 RepID=UPI000C87048E|nr:uncharacterized protein LOC6569983 isoform X1 [Drosophila grimshawi]
MPNLSGSLKPSRRSEATTSASAAPPAAATSKLLPTAAIYHLRRTNASAGGTADPVSAGALFGGLSSPSLMKPPPCSRNNLSKAGVASTAAATRKLRVTIVNASSSRSCSGVKSSKSVRLPPSSSSIAQAQIKKSSLARKSAASSRIAAADVVSGGSRKVKFSTNVHTFPSSTSDRKDLRIGELQLKKQIKKLRHNNNNKAQQRSPSSGGQNCAASLANKLALSFSTHPPSVSVLGRDIQQHGAIVDVEPVKAPKRSGRKALPICGAPKRKAPIAAVAAATGTRGNVRQSNKRPKKSRIQAGGAAAVGTASCSRPAPRLAYSVQQQKVVKGGKTTTFPFTISSSCSRAEKTNKLRQSRTATMDQHQPNGDESDQSRRKPTDSQHSKRKDESTTTNSGGELVQQNKSKSLEPSTKLSNNDDATILAKKRKITEEAATVSAKTNSEAIISASGPNTSNTQAAASAASEQDDKDKEDDKDAKKKKNRCGECRKKVGLTGFQCRCGGLYCAVHRYSDKHNCTFDYREHGAQEIRRNNPVVVGEKIQKI